MILNNSPGESRAITQRLPRFATTVEDGIARGKQGTAHMTGGERDVTELLARTVLVMLIVLCSFWCVWQMSPMVLLGYLGLVLLLVPVIALNTSWDDSGGLPPTLRSSPRSNDTNTAGEELYPLKKNE